MIKDKDGTILRIFLNRKEQWCLPPDNKLPISEKLKTALLLYEDRFFYRHQGINPISILRAVYQNVTSGRNISGASTLTMQVTRLMHPKSRTLANKLFEIFQAVKIELLYSKEEILRLYFTHAPYGGNIVGLQAASLRYFGKEPSFLTWSESAVLAVLPNSPGLISPLVNQKKLIKKRNRLLKKLYEKQQIDSEAYRLAVIEPLPAQEFPFPLEAPHLAQYLKSVTNATNQSLNTTIDLSIQRQVQSIMQQHCRYLENFGIENVAALVTETKSGKIRAYLGSQEFFDPKKSGQVDGIRAARSTGSILKPFLYALSFDKGIILPKTLLKDVPSYFGTFSPANADQKFNGMVSAKEALIHSLNVPAVRLLFSYGYYSFYLFLKDAGLSTLFRLPDDYGLPLILGGAEANLWDLTILYRGLANDGNFSNLHILEWEDGQNSNVTNKKIETVPKNLISPGACWLTLNILNELKRPGAEYYWELYQQQWPLAWKTGTSYGQRDAWAVGSNPEWTIAVWVGNFDGKPNKELSGAKIAGPLLFDIFNTLPKKQQKSWFQKPLLDLKNVTICLQTGFQAGENCQDIMVVDAPLAMKPLKICTYHAPLYICKEKESLVCSLCWTPNNYKKVVKLIYPPDVSQYLRERGQIISKLPQHNQRCPSVASGEPVRIIYPSEKTKIWLPRDIFGQLQKVILRAAHQAEDQTLFWYLDNLYLGDTSQKHTKVAELSEGWHTLEVVDLEGNRDVTSFYVNRYKFPG